MSSLIGRKGRCEWIVTEQLTAAALGKDGTARLNPMRRGGYYLLQSAVGCIALDPERGESHLLPRYTAGDEGAFTRY